MSRRNINSGVANNILYPAKFPTSLAGITLAYVVVQNTTLNMNTILLFTSLRLCTQYVYKTSLLMSLSFRLFFTFLFISIPVVSFPFVFQFPSLYFLQFLSCSSVRFLFLHTVEIYTPTASSEVYTYTLYQSSGEGSLVELKKNRNEPDKTCKDWMRAHLNIRDIRRERRTPESHDVRNIAPRIMEDVKRKGKKEEKGEVILKIFHGLYSEFCRVLAAVWVGWSSGVNALSPSPWTSGGARARATPTPYDNTLGVGRITTDLSEVILTFSSGRQ